MMDMMMKNAKTNMEVLAQMQAKNEEMIRTMLSYAAKTREQVLATNESLLAIVAQQGKAAETMVTESVKASREAVEKQVQDIRTAVAAN